MSDFKKAAVSTAALLHERNSPFRTDLRVIARTAGISSTPVRALFTLFNDVISLPDVTNSLGCAWCLSQISGNDVQFNPVVSVIEDGNVELFEEPNPTSDETCVLRLRALTSEFYRKGHSFPNAEILDIYAADKDILKKVLPDNLFDYLRLCHNNRKSNFHQKGLKAALLEYFDLGQPEFTEPHPDDDES